MKKFYLIILITLVIFSICYIACESNKEPEIQEVIDTTQTDTLIIDTLKLIKND